MDKFRLLRPGSSFYLSLSVNLTLHFFYFADFIKLHIPNAQTKFYEILPAHTKLHHDTIHKIANRYFELKYHFSTFFKQQISNVFEQGCICALRPPLVQMMAVTITLPWPLQSRSVFKIVMFEQSVCVPVTLKSSMNSAKHVWAAIGIRIQRGPGLSEGICLIFG